MNEAMASVEEVDRKERRRAAIMEAAFALFIEKGYNNVGMTEVIKRSGGSLATAYGLFENKAGLLRAIISAGCDQFHLNVSEIVQAGSTPESTLKALAKYLLKELLGPKNVGLVRIIVTESIHDPSIGDHFRRSAPEKATWSLREVFLRWHDEGALDVDDPLRAAETFLSLLLHKHQMSALCGFDVVLTAAEIDSQVDHVVRTILYRYAPGQSARGI